MAFFGVTIEEIGSIDQIEGADRIVKATLKNVSFSFVVGKGLFNVADKVLYFPIDALIPIEVQRKLGVEGKLAGKEKNRVKTVKLKNTISTGLVGSLSLIDGLVDTSPESITQFLGVTKYEPLEIFEKGGNLHPLPPGLSIYDLESTDRNQNIVDYMMDKLVRCDEKMEGQNIHFDYVEDVFYVSQRRHTIDPITNSEHTWWKYANEMNLEHITKTISKRYGKNVALYGEGLGNGIQGNYYSLNKHLVLFFDIKIGDDFIDTDAAISLFNEFNLPMVPILSINTTLRDWLNNKNIKEVADGQSKIIDKKREGIVIRLMKEEIIPKYGRSIIKKRGEIYLSQTDF